MNVDPSLLCDSWGSCRSNSGNSVLLFSFLPVDETFTELVQVLAAGVTWKHHSRAAKASIWAASAGRWVISILVTQNTCWTETIYAGRACFPEFGSKLYVSQFNGGFSLQDFIFGVIFCGYTWHSDRSSKEKKELSKEPPKKVKGQWKSAGLTTSHCL